MAKFTKQEDNFKNHFKTADLKICDVDQWLFHH